MNQAHIGGQVSQQPEDSPKQNFLTEFKKSSLLDKIFVGLLVFVPVAALAGWLGLPPLAVFGLSALAILPLAKLISNATEALSEKVGPAVGGLLNATFGNAVELLIAVLALSEGLTEVVKASITGALVANLLFVLGLAMLVGGIGRDKQHFNPVSAGARVSQLNLAAIALIIPAVFTATLGNTPEPSRTDLQETLSLIVAGLLVVSYIGQLVFFFFTHSYLGTSATKKPEPGADNSPPDQGRAGEEAMREELESEAPAWGMTRSIITLLGATALAAYISEILVNSIEPLTKQFGWTELFVGVILVALVGGAAEYVTAVSAAAKNKMNLAVNVTIDSTLQMVMFVAPLLVFVGFFIGHRLNLEFVAFELAAIIVAILLVNRTVADGESNWFEGLQLLVAYAVVAVAFFLHP